MYSLEGNSAVDLKAPDASARNRGNINDDAGQDKGTKKRIDKMRGKSTSSLPFSTRELSGDALRVSVMTSNVGTPRYDMIVHVTTHR
jgi:hypothetical protein